MDIDLTKDIEVLQGMYGTGSLPYGKVIGEMFVSSMQPCDTGLLPSHLLTHWNTRSLLGADELLDLYAELEAYRRLFENAPKMLALLRDTYSIVNACHSCIVCDEALDNRYNELFNTIEHG